MQENKVKISDLMNNRFDPYFHLPHFYNEMEELTKSPFKIYKLINLCTQITDGTHYTPTYVNLGIKFISVKDIKENSIDFSNTKFISQEEHKLFIKRCNPQPGDILLTKIGTIGNVCIVPNDAPDFSIFVSVALLKLNKKIVSPLYMQAALSTYFAKSQMKRELKGIGVPDLHLENICNIQIPIPDKIEEQNKIAEIFQKAYEKKKIKYKKAQDLITSVNEIILDTLNIKLSKIDKQKVYKTSVGNLINNRIDVEYHQPMYEELEFLLINNPNCTNLSRAFDANGLIKGYLPKDNEKDGNIKYLQIKNVLQEGYIDTQNFANANDGIYKKSQKLNKDDIIIVATGATIGKVGLWDNENDCYLGGDMFKFKASKDFYPYYILAYLLSPLGQLQIKRNITGATNGHLSPIDIENIKIIKLPMYIQKNISEAYKEHLKNAKELRKQADIEFDLVKEKVERIILGKEVL